MQLSREIDKAKRSVTTDAYQMSIGEIINMYKDDDLVINPNFQRLFRWELYQKSRLIESILLGIPLPSIFVFETKEGQWELVDGLQRISTLLEFMGLLKDPDTLAERPPIALVGTKYLPSLDGAVWDEDGNLDDDTHPLEKNQQFSTRRSRISVEILKQPSDAQTKYDLFQRLNAGGTQANKQELRNVIALMVNEKFFKKVSLASEDSNFLALVQVTDDAKKRQRHIELTMRFLVFFLVEYDKKKDVEEYIDDGIVKIADGVDYMHELNVLRETCKLIRDAFDDDALKRYEDGKHKGFVSSYAFESIVLGVARNLDKIRNLNDAQEFVRRKITEFWQAPELETFLSPGLRGTQRIQRTLPFGEKWFLP